MGKSLGFSKEEFSVICDVFDIDKLVCFETEEESVLKENTISEVYHQLLFQLYKKVYIILEETDFVLSKEVKDIFSILKKCESVISISTKDENVPGYCIYFSGEDDFVLMRGGTRTGEYVKIEMLSKDEFLTFLKESEVLLPETLWEDFPKMQGKRDIVGEELRKFLESGNLENAEELWEIPQVTSLFRVQNPRSGTKKCYLAVVKQPIQDRIVVINGENIQIVTYSEKRMLELLQEIQEKENGIGGCDCSQCE